jgi:hypothetical protein
VDLHLVDVAREEVARRGAVAGDAHCVRGRDRRQRPRRDDGVCRVEVRGCVRPVVYARTMPPRTAGERGNRRRRRERSAAVAAEQHATGGDRQEPLLACRRAGVPVRDEPAAGVRCRRLGPRHHGYVAREVAGRVVRPADQPVSPAERATAADLARGVERGRGVRRHRVGGRLAVRQRFERPVGRPIRIVSVELAVRVGRDRRLGAGVAVPQVNRIGRSRRQARHLDPDHRLGVSGVELDYVTGEAGRARTVAAEPDVPAVVARVREDPGGRFASVSRTEKLLTPPLPTCAAGMVIADRFAQPVGKDCAAGGTQ